jgi:hypothetical protein
MHALARVLEHFPTPRQTRLQQSYSRQNGTFLEPISQSKPIPPMMPPARAKRGHR